MVVGWEMCVTWLVWECALCSYVNISVQSYCFCLIDLQLYLFPGISSICYILFLFCMFHNSFFLLESELVYGCVHSVSKLKTLAPFDLFVNQLHSMGWKYDLINLFIKAWFCIPRAPVWVSPAWVISKVCSQWTRTQDSSSKHLLLVRCLWGNEHKNNVRWLPIVCRLHATVRTL